jgi:hypothetical protein
MILVETIMNIKVVELNKIYNIYFGHFFIRQIDSNVAHKIYISLSLIVYETTRVICKICE